MSLQHAAFAACKLLAQSKQTHVAHPSGGQHATSNLQLVTCNKLLFTSNKQQTLSIGKAERNGG